MRTIKSAISDVLYKSVTQLAKILNHYNLRIVRSRKHMELIEIQDKYLAVNKWATHQKNIDTDLVKFIVSKIYEYPKYSQLQQDLVAEFIANLSQKKTRFFIEFGASDGITYSNTYLLEKSFGWQGVLAEPGKNWHTVLRKNRNSTIDNRCVWSYSNQSVEFAESREGEYSTIRKFISNDSHQNQRLNSNFYKVPTVSLNDLLECHKVPQNINYLSIDTEGSEYEILSTFNIKKYNIDFITVEHNFTRNRDLIFRFMTENGYIRILEELSEWDDWYISESVAKLMFAIHVK